MRQGDLRDRLEHTALRALGEGVRRMPAGAAYRFGDLLGRTARFLGLRRRVTESHVGAAFPDRSPEWVRETARSAYRHFGREAVAVARLGADGGPDVRLREEAVAGFREAYRERVPEGSGAVLVTGHLGNWEVGAAVVGEAGIPAVAVVKSQRNPRVDRWLRRRRARAGVETVPLYRAGRRLTRALADGELVLLVADQDALGLGIFVDFMGRPASTHRGPAALSLRHDVPLLFSALVRESQGPLAPYRCVLETVDRMDLPSGGSRRPWEEAGTGARHTPAEKEMTRRWVATLERHVREHPGQYLWFHRRWKTRPPGDPPERPPAGNGTKS